MQLFNLQCWLKISENLINTIVILELEKPTYTVIGPIALYATYPTCPLKLFNQVVWHITIHIMYVYMKTGASEEITYSHPLEFSLSFFKKEKRKLQRTYLSVKSLWMVLQPFIQM